MKFEKFWKRLDPAKTPTSTVETRTEAANAVQQSEAAYQEAKEQAPRVDEIVKSLRTQREKNHFGELIQTTMEGVG